MILVNKFFFFFFLLILSCDSTQNETILYGETMGTTYSIKIIDNVIDETIIKSNIDSLLFKINNHFSTYIDDSEISLINSSKLSETPLSQYFIYVLDRALKYCQLSNNLYDVTVSPLVHLWGFYDYSYDNFPSEESINQCLQNIGCEQVLIKNSSIVKKNKDIILDLNSLAKGYALDIIYDFLNESGYNNYLIEIGGEVRTKNTKTKNWIVGIQNPQSSKIIKKIKVNNLSMATSGNYNNYFVKDGIEYSHIINPLTGYPIENYILSSTVISEKCIDADALATMLMLVGAKEGVKIIDKIKNVECMLVIKDVNDEQQLVYSENFKKFIVD